MNLTNLNSGLPINSEPSAASFYTCWSFTCFFEPCGWKYTGIAQLRPMHPMPNTRKDIDQAVGSYLDCTPLDKFNIFLHSYAPRSLPRGAQRRTFFDSCLLELKTWKYTLPTELHTKVAGESSKYPHSYVLSMVYHTSIILLAKPFLRKKLNPALAHTDSPLRIEEDVASKTATLCMDAAKNVCLLGEQYRETFGSFRRAPISVTHCTLSAALMLLYGPVEATSQHTNTECIQSCVVTLRELSDSWMPAQNYWRSVLCIFRDRQRSTFGTPKETPSTRPVVRSIYTEGGSLPLQDLSEASHELFESPVSNSWADDSSFPEVSVEDLNLASMFPLGSLFAYDDFEGLNIPPGLS